MQIDQSCHGGESELLEHLRAYRHLVVAFSGGTDSSFLLAAAQRALGPENVLAATVVSPSLASGELESARAFAEELGVRHVAVPGAEIDRPGYRENGRDRCAHCKTELMEVLLPIAESRFGANAVVATGTNADDAVDPHRPGIAAAGRLGAATPLARLRMSKAEIRRLSHDWGLSTWDKPQAACLASRIAYGVPVTEKGLRRVDRAELLLRELFNAESIPVTNLRVRDLGAQSAHIEVDAQVLHQVLAIEAQVAELVRSAGFAEAEVDPRGFRSGSLNEPVLLTLELPTPLSSLR
ncbi:MAG: ATP-dependent sacrificial sulfur transferase LarE [Candidatus Nanopelagicales bacterium]